MNYIRVSVSEMLRIRNPSLTIAQGESHSLSANNRKPLSYMFSMLITVPFRTSSAISSLQVDGLNKQAYVTFKNGKSYAYGNVSTRAILNVLFNPDGSLGFWVNNNLVNSQRAEQTPELSDKLFDTQVKTDGLLNREGYAKLAKKNEEVKLPSFA